MKNKTNLQEVSFKNNGKLKLLIIVGTRPEIIRLAAVIKKCRKYFDTILAHTGQNYDYALNQVFFEELGLREPDYYLNLSVILLMNNLKNPFLFQNVCLLLQIQKPYLQERQLNTKI